ncbi:uncharacterized protein [Diadema antillarum]|uniref:uncharacterized protein n=1 Tax=Diadema antillarum TaxID=105358 RepID=UPI003A8BFE55
MRTEAKTVHVDERPSFAGSLVTIFAGQGARAAESKTLRDTLPGKSRVGRILLNDNHSQDRLLDMKLADIQQMRRKAEIFISHQQKTFIAKMEKRQNTWVREHSRFSSNTNLVMPTDDLVEDVPPTRETTKSQLLEGADITGRKSSRSAPNDGKASGEHGANSSLPNITYMTEDSENSPRDGTNPGGTSFLKEPEPYERRPRMFVGLPPITQAKRSGFQPSGNIDEMFDDKALRKKIQWTTSGETAGNESPTKRANVQSTEPADPNAPQTGRESKVSAIEEEEIEETTYYGPTPVFVLSRNLPRIQIREPMTRKFRFSKVQQPKVRQRHPRTRSGAVNESDDPLADDRFLKLQQLLASDIVKDHESRELSALARGMLAAKRFGRSKKKEEVPAEKEA